MNKAIIESIIGGGLIGLSTVIFLVTTGRITGISGIFRRAIWREDQTTWRWYFLAGLFAGGILISIFLPDAFDAETESPVYIILAGLLVGVGTAMSGGCTSGHGICGVSRLSKRSIVATLIFMAAGILSVYIGKKWIFS